MEIRHKTIYTDSLIWIKHHDGFYLFNRNTGLDVARFKQKRTMKLEEIDKADFLELDKLLGIK